MPSYGAPDRRSPHTRARHRFHKAPPLPQACARLHLWRAPHSGDTAPFIRRADRGMQTRAGPAGHSEGQHQIRRPFRRAAPMNADASYPRPLMQRSSWTSLDGSWDFALDPENQWSEPAQVEWDTRITVPFAPETPASGVEAKGLFNACWYRRQFHCERPDDDRVVLLHFGAVDYEARVWLNGAAVGHHEGGYSLLKIEVTP